MNDSFSIQGGSIGGHSTGFSPFEYDEFAGNLKIYAHHKMFHGCWNTK